MKLIVGLGNPGREYKKTRHNIGYMILDEYLGPVEWKIKNDANVYITEFNNEQVIFLKPLTYMNLSGIAVKKIVDYYKISIEDILVIQDDLDIEVGNFKIKRNSSSGGHNGIKSIISSLKTEAFARLKIGIGKSDTIPTDKYVLSKFSSSDLKKIMNNLENFNDIIEIFIKENIEKVMAIYNKK